MKLIGSANAEATTLLSALNSELHWGIRETALDAMYRQASAIDMRASLEAFYSSADSAAPEKPYEMDGAIAIIPVCGPLMKSGGFWTWLFGGTSMDRLQALFETAGIDPEVESVRIVFDTPGGTVAGAADTAAAIRALRALKPVQGYIADSCCSVGYWLAAQCSEIVANAKTAEIGNIGTLLRVDDISKMFAAQGIEPKLYRSAPLKGAGTPGVAITPEQDAEFQSMVDAANEVFVADVATGRGVTIETARGWATAHVYLGAEALEAGLVDRIAIQETAGVVEPTDPAGTDGDEDDDEDDDDLDARRKAGTPQASAWGRTEARARSNWGAATVPDRSGPPQTASSPAKSKGKPMKETIIRLLNAFGLQTLAMSVFQEKEDTPEAVVAAMASSVTAQVEVKVREHPLISGLEAGGVKDVEGLKGLLKMASFGETALTDLRGETKAEAIRLYGAENGPKISAQVHSMEPAEVKALRDAWRTEADAKFGHGSDGSAPGRISAGLPLREAAPATGEPETEKAPREKLNAVQLAHAGRMGYKTEAELDAFAENVLADEAVRKTAVAA
jgi:signal peptide peptidase SppA